MLLKLSQSFQCQELTSAVNNLSAVYLGTNQATWDLLSENRKNNSPLILVYA